MKVSKEIEDKIFKALAYDTPLEVVNKNYLRGLCAEIVKKDAVLSASKNFSHLAGWLADEFVASVLPTFRGLIIDRLAAQGYTAKAEEYTLYLGREAGWATQRRQGMIVYHNGAAVMSPDDGRRGYRLGSQTPSEIIVDGVTLSYADLGNIYNIPEVPVSATTIADGMRGMFE